MDTYLTGDKARAVLCMMLLCFGLLVLPTLRLEAIPLHAQPTPSEDIVFQRPLAAQGTLTATRQEVPDDPPKQPPPAPLVYATPAHVYQYEFLLTLPQGQKKLLHPMPTASIQNQRLSPVRWRKTRFR